MDRAEAGEPSHQSGEVPSDSSSQDIVASLEKLSIGEEEVKYPAVTPALLNRLQKAIKAGDYEAVEEIIWSNPRCLVSVCDSAVYVHNGMKINACHMAARENKPDIMALLLDTVSKISFIRKIYPKEPDDNVQDRVNHLLDSYLNTPDPRKGNTPLHFACKLGHYKVVRVLLTFEGCDIHLKDSEGRTAEESICAQARDDGDSVTRQKIKSLFKCQLHSPLHQVQLKKRLILAKRRNKADGYYDSDNSFSDDSFIFSPNKKPT